MVNAKLALDKAQQNKWEGKAGVESLVAMQ